MTTDNRTPSRTLTDPFLAIFLDGEGAHPAAGGGAASAAAARIQGRAALAESAGAAAIVVGDGPIDAAASAHPQRLSSTVLGSFLAPKLRRASVVPQADAVFTEPFHLATQLMTLDHIALGRSGWLVYGTGSKEEGSSVGRGAAEDLNREVTDAVEVVRRIWDTWEDDAVIRDVSTGRFIDREKVHYADFVGENYSVKGPSITPRSPQGQLPVFAPLALAGDPAAEPGTGRPELDGVVVRGATIEETLAGAGRAREAGHRLVLAEAVLAADHAGEPGAERWHRLEGEAAFEEDDVAVLAGAADEAADALAELARVSDGLLVRLAESDADLDEAAFSVIPKLRERVALAEPRPGSHLRDLLGLEHPESRFAAQG